MFETQSLLLMWYSITLFIDRIFIINKRRKDFLGLIRNNHRLSDAELEFGRWEYCALYHKWTKATANHFSWLTIEMRRCCWETWLKKWWTQYNTSSRLRKQIRDTILDAMATIHNNGSTTIWLHYYTIFYCYFYSTYSNCSLFFEWTTLCYLR